MRADPSDAAPVLAICGHSGSGKTTLIERLVPELRAWGWRVAVVKRTHHRVTVDVPGKDSDRFYRAGASVCLQAGDETFVRETAPQDGETWRATLHHLVSTHDFVLVEGHKETPLAKVWLLGPGEREPPPHVANILTVLGRDADRLAPVRALCLARAARAWAARPVFGAVILDRDPDRALVTRALARLAPHVGRAVVVGDQAWPTMATLPPVPLVARGALAGTLAAVRWAPEAAWLVVRPSLALTAEALAEVLAQRRPGRWALLARAGVDATLFEPQARAALEEAAVWEQPAHASCSGVAG